MLSRNRVNYPSIINAATVIIHEVQGSDFVSSRSCTLSLKKKKSKTTPSKVKRNISIRVLPFEQRNINITYRDEKVAAEHSVNIPFLLPFIFYENSTFADRSSQNETAFRQLSSHLCAKWNKFAVTGPRTFITNWYFYKRDERHLWVKELALTEVNWELKHLCIAVTLFFKFFEKYAN